VVAICNHLGLLLPGQLEREVGRKPLGVAPCLLVEPLRAHAVELGEVGIDEHLLRLMLPTAVLSRRFAP